MDEKAMELLKLCLVAKAKGHNVMFNYSQYIMIAHFNNATIVADFNIIEGTKYANAEYDKAVAYLKGLIRKNVG